MSFQTLFIMDANSLLESEKSRVKHKISLLERQYWDEQYSEKKKSDKSVIPWFAVFPLVFFIILLNESYTNKFNYWVIPLGIYNSYLFYKIFVWWEELKEIKKQISYTKQHLEELRIEYNTYENLEDTLFEMKKEAEEYHKM